MTRRSRITSAILVLGLAASLVIYLRAQAPADNPLGYDPEDTKRYRREMEVYGGTANLLASDVREWLVSLWHGERLAFTVAFLTALSAAGYRFFSRPIAPVEDETDSS